MAIKSGSVTLGGLTYNLDNRDRVAAQIVQESFMELTSNNLTVTAGSGFDGIAEAFGSGAIKIGGVYHTTILIDLTGIRSTAAADIIGDDGSSNVAHIGQITAARNGTIYAGKVTCLELPAGGDPDIDLWYATEATGVEDGAIADLTETQLTDGGDHALGDIDYFSAGVAPAADSYLYLVAGATTDGDYTAGRLLIEMWGA
tara:strand:- start:673 stop:1275 length:603 start_codon:yes stop_codon:yes gene_type:complete